MQFSLSLSPIAAFPAAGTRRVLHDNRARSPANLLAEFPAVVSLATAAPAIGAIAMPYLSRAADRPVVTHGVQSGDVGADGGVVWARADRPSQMMVEVATTESFADARALPPIAALPESDFTAKMLLENLPAGQDIFYRVRFRDLSHIDIESEPVIGRFRTAPADRRDVSFVWGGDVAGQGWGINPDDGGMFTFATMRKHHPDFLLHSGDTIYADGPITARGQACRRQGLEERHHSGEGQGRRDARRVPRRVQVQFHGRACARLQRRGADLRAMGRSRGHQQLVAVEAAARGLQGARHQCCSPRARARAFHEMYPMRESLAEPGRVYRTLNYGPHLDVFMLDERSYRGPNGDNLADELTVPTATSSAPSSSPG